MSLSLQGLFHGLTALSLAFALAATLGQLRAQTSSALTTARAVRSLIPEQASQAKPVRLRGVVTVLSGWRSSFFFQDATSGISVDRSNDSPTLQPGELVEIRGVTGPGKFAPVVLANSVAVLGEGKMPSARLVGLDKLAGGKQDGQWLALRGIVRSGEVEPSWGRPVLFLDLDIGAGNMVKVRVHDFSRAGWHRLPGATISVRGVCGTVFNDKRQFTGLRLFVSSLEEVTVERPAPSDPFDLPLRSLGSLLEFDDAEGAIRRIKVSGVVTYAQPGQGFYIQDGSRGVYVQSRQTTPVPLNARLEVVGYPATSRYSPTLEDAVFRVVSMAQPLVGLALATSAMIVDNDGFPAAPYDSVLVQLKGRLMEAMPGVDADVLLLQNGSAIFTARLPRSGKSHRALAPGSLIRITGICVAKADSAHDPRSFDILMRSSADVIVLKSAPWWTAAHAQSVVVLLILVLLLMTGWLAVLRRADETSRRATKLAEESSRIKSDFLANMSHEIRTPMNAILGMTYLAQRAGPPPQQREYLTKIGNAAQSLLSIMNDILDFSKIEAGKLDLECIPFSLDEVLRNLVDIVGPQAGKKGIAIVYSVAQEVPGSLLGDPLRLGQILINLVNNAVKFSDRGEIVVTVMVEAMTPAGIQLAVSIRDQGIGMSPGQIANLFQAFNQGDTSFTRKYGGTGLGLAICKQLCELMRGSLSVESELGRGSTFLFTASFGVALDETPHSHGAFRDNLRKRSDLLANESEHACGERVDGAEPDPQLAPDDLSCKLAGRRVLLVEDNEINRDLVSELLADYGVEVAIAVNGREGVDRVAAEAFDLVLMDIQMPVMDGLTATKLIRAEERFRKLPILAITALAMREDRERSLEAGMNDHLTKPISPHVLRDALLRWIATPPAAGAVNPAF
jgi:signal transduction histidine kinase/CheY-like chemotaxis protein